jgi:hypothetical protein
MQKMKKILIKLVFPAVEPVSGHLQFIAYVPAILGTGRPPLVIWVKKEMPHQVRHDIKKVILD